jgi:hypothetical protein
MLKFLIGPVLAVIVWVVGSYYGRNAEQLVHKSPNAVYAALSNIVDESKERDPTVKREDGRPMQMALDVTAHDPGKSLSMQLLFDGQAAVTADVTLTPEQDGKATLMKVKLHGDHAVLRDKLAGSKQARLAYAPDWLLNLTFRPVLKSIGEDIDKEQDFASILRSGSEAQGAGTLSPDQQRQMEQAQQYEAARPITDPNADAERYLRGE